MEKETFFILAQLVFPAWFSLCGLARSLFCAGPGRETTNRIRVLDETISSERKPLGSKNETSFPDALYWPYIRTVPDMSGWRICVSNIGYKCRP